MKLGNRGQVNKNLVTGIAVILVTIAVVAYALTVILSAIPTTSTGDSLGENVMGEINTKAPTIFTLLIVVVIIIVIGVLLRALGVF